MCVCVYLHTFSICDRDICIINEDRGVLIEVFHYLLTMLDVYIICILTVTMFYR